MIDKDLLYICPYISFVTCLIVIFIIYFYKLLERPYNKLIMYITVCDLFSSLSLASLGHSESGSIECYTQGITTNYFQLASFFWSVVVAYEVYVIVYHLQQQEEGIELQSNIKLQLLMWLSPALITVFPFFFNQKYEIGDDVIQQQCFLSNNNIVFNIVGFYLWLAVSIFVMIYFISISIRKLSIVFKNINNAANHVVIRLTLFPSIIILCWFTSTVQQFSFFFGSNFFQEDIISYIQYYTSSLQGFFTSISFIFMNLDLFYVKKTSLIINYTNNTFMGTVDDIEGKSYGSNNTSSSNFSSNLLSNSLITNSTLHDTNISEL